MVKIANISEKGRDDRTGLLKDEELTSRIIETFNECIIRFDVQNPTKTPYSIILFDVDYFKALNDLFGYEYGNSVLSGIGEILLPYESKEEFIGVLGRWGGEEFIIALPYAPSKRAKYIANDVRELIEKFSFEDPITQEKSLKEFITVSMGVSCIDLEELLFGIKKESHEDWENQVKDVFRVLTREANCALDYAKFMGKNRVEEFSDYLKQELDNLNLIRTFYFKYSNKKPEELNKLFEDAYLKMNLQIKDKINRHFEIIRDEINPKDTRTQALFADNIYRLVSKEGEIAKNYFLEFIRKLI